MQKQYAEENRPLIEVEFLFERRSFYGLRFINHGKSTAQNVEIQLSDAFIDSLGSTNFAELLKKQKGKKCVIGVDQHYDLFFANDTYIQLPNKVPATGTIHYEDNGVKYQSEFDIDTEHYATIFSLESDEERIVFFFQTLQLFLVFIDFQHFFRHEEKETAQIFQYIIIKTFFVWKWDMGQHFDRIFQFVRR